ncbi:phosphoribosyltransferase [Mycobacteroides chelonae]|uniref:ComF family protein n=1 Tax=Mycobacteroides chelonae TaxID=1774 RepID=UPI0030C71723
MTDPELLASISVALSRVSYFHTIAGPGPGICNVCRGPAPASGICSRCVANQQALGGATCDRTFFLTYVDGQNPYGRSQSVQTMRMYKEGHPPPKRNVDDVHLLTNTSTGLHDDCMREAENGQGWDVATFVPSRTPRNGLHPVAGIARNVARLLADDPARGGPYRITRVLLAPGPVNAPREADAGRFSVPDDVRPVVDGKRVLLVDDTWTSGTSLQLAAAALKIAGSASVTGLCVARWLSWDWDSHVPLLKQVAAKPYDPFRCIAFNRSCVPDRAR